MATSYTPIGGPVADRMIDRDLARSARKSQRKSVQSAVTPLEYMLAAVRDEAASPARRDRMALAAARYCHRQAKR
jgi:hypothetical protein